MHPATFVNKNSKTLHNIQVVPSTVFLRTGATRRAAIEKMHRLEAPARVVGLNSPTASALSTPSATAPRNSSKGGATASNGNGSGSRGARRPNEFGLSSTGDGNAHKASPGLGSVICPWRGRPVPPSPSAQRLSELRLPPGLGLRRLEKGGADHEAGLGAGGGAQGRLLIHNHAPVRRSRDALPRAIRA